MGAMLDEQEINARCSKTIENLELYSSNIGDIALISKELDLLCNYDLAMNKLLDLNMNFDDYYSDLVITIHRTDNLIEDIKEFVNEKDKFRDIIYMESFSKMVEGFYSMLVDEMSMFITNLKKLSKLKIKPAQYLNRDKNTIREAKSYQERINKYLKTLYPMAFDLANRIKKDYSITWSKHTTVRR